VWVERIGDFIKAGCVGVGFGSSVMKNEWIESRNWGGISKAAADYVRAMKEAKA
jgi:2-keto-3-deoxy-6-phosphogluconate aldolase